MSDMYQRVTDERDIFKNFSAKSLDLKATWKEKPGDHQTS